MTIMKKVLLVTAVALVTISVSAANRKYFHKAQITKERKTVKATPGAFKSMADKMEAANAFYNMPDCKSGKMPSSCFRLTLCLHPYSLPYWVVK